MSQENVEVVRRLLDAFNARDLDRFARLTTEDFEWSPSMVAIDGEVLLGREGIETYFGRMIDAWDEFRVADGEFRDLGDRVLWRGRLDGRGRISGALVSAPLDILYGLRDGQVSSMRSFLDHTEALKAVGLEQ
jgi:ketosteroid isomerase-like protein